MRHLNPTDFRGLFESRCFQRGLRYFIEGLVLGVDNITEYPDGVVFEARVRGSGQRIYQQEINIDWSSG